MRAQFIEENIKYDGSQLRSLFAYMNYGVLGDSVVAWVGPCDVGVEHMLDGEDLRAKSSICGSQMVHFVVERFSCHLATAVALQRLTTAMAIDVLRRLSPRQDLTAALRRDGDDIFGSGTAGGPIGQKLSISIATVSPVSALIHFAVNVTNDGTPVSTLSLQDLQVEPKAFANALMESLCNEILSIQAATCKVRPTTSY